MKWGGLPSLFIAIVLFYPLPSMDVVHFLPVKAERNKHGQKVILCGHKGPAVAPWGHHFPTDCLPFHI